MNRSLPAFLLALMVFNACEKDPASAPVGAIGFVSPAANSAVYDSVEISLIVSSGIPVSRLVLLIDGASVRSFTAPPYSYTWYTGHYTDGSRHVLEARMVDAEGVDYEAAPVTIDVFRFRPSMLSATFLTDTTVQVLWNDNSRIETGYEIEQQVNSAPFVTVATVDSNVTSAVVTLQNQFGDTVRYRVRAMRGTEKSDYTPVVTAHRTLPVPVITSCVALNDTTISVRWIDRTAHETGYLVTLYGPNGQVVMTTQLPANSVAAEFHTPLMNGSLYQVYVRPWREQFQSSSGAAVGVYFAVPVPNTLSITSDAPTSVTVQWKDTCSYETAYRVERSTGNGPFTTVGTVAPNVFLFKDMTVDTAQQYTYRIVTVSRHTASAASVPVAVRYVHGLVFVNSCNAPDGAGSFTLNKTGTMAVTTDFNSRSISIWDLNAMRRELTFSYVDSTSQGPQSAALHPDGTKVAVGFYYNYFMTFDAASGTRTSYVDPASNTTMGIVSLAYNNDGSKLVTSGWGIHVWQNGSNAKIGSLKASGYTYDIAISPTEEKIVTNLRTGSAHVYDIGNLTLSVTLEASSDVYQFGFSNDGTRIIGKNTSDIIVWDVSSGAVVHRMKNFYNTSSAALLNKEQLLFTSHMYEGLKVWDLNTGTLNWSFKGQLTEQEWIRLSPDGRFVYTMGGYTMRKWGLSRMWNAVQP